MASDPPPAGTKTPGYRIGWGRSGWKGSDFATHYPVGLAGFPRGLLEQITDDDTITVMALSQDDRAELGVKTAAYCPGPFKSSGDCCEYLETLAVP